MKPRIRSSKATQSAVLIALTLGGTGLAWASDTPTPAPPRSTAITVSLTTPIWGIYELGWEQAWGSGLSTLLMVGAGAVEMDEDDDRGDTVDLLEVGLQARYTFVGDFDDGMGIAVVGRYFWMSPLVDGSQPKAYTLGPHLFWRISTEMGLTLDYHLGLGFEAASLEHPRGVAPRERSEIRPSGGLSLGWSFGR